MVVLLEFPRHSCQVENRNFDCMKNNATTRNSAASAAYHIGVYGSHRRAIMTPVCIIAQVAT